MKKHSRSFNIIKRIFIVAILVFLACFSSQKIDTDINVVAASGDALTSELWNSDKAEIDKNNKVSGEYEYILMSNFYTIVNDNFTILDPNNTVRTYMSLTSAVNDQTIKDDYRIVIENALDLYYFSEACNDSIYYNKYLNYSYVLGNDIDYTDAAKLYKFFKPIGWKTEGESVDATNVDSFKGIFDGQGFTISNLLYYPIENGSLLFTGIAYYSMFSVVGTAGIVKNVGLINPIVLQGDTYDGQLSYAAPLAGINFGTIDHVYMIDNRRFEMNGAGLTAEGGFNISGLISVNQGTLSNAYVSTVSVVSTSVVITNLLSAVLSTNNGILKNVFYDATVLNTEYANYNNVDGVKAIVDTNNNIDFLEKMVNFTKNEYFTNHSVSEGSMSESQREELDLIVNDVKDKWYAPSSYTSTIRTTIRANYGNYPILRGLDIISDSNDDYAGYYEIAHAVDFATMFELIDKIAYFRRANFVIIDNIDLKGVSSDAIKLLALPFSGHFTSKKMTPEELANFNNKCYLVDGSASPFYSVINAKINKGISIDGYRVYGVFSYLEGTIDNINFVNIEVQPLDLKDSTTFLDNTTLGLVCGVLDDGMINNVNAHGNIILDTGATNNVVGRVLAGGICGSANTGSIQDCTTTGYINENKTQYYNSSINNSSIGGIVGLVNNTSNIHNCLNAMNINALKVSNIGNNSFTQYVGGIIGSGNSVRLTNLANKGNITADATTQYVNGNLYMTGGIGYHTSSTTRTSNIYNCGMISYYLYNQTFDVYIAGVVNVRSNNPLTYIGLTNASTINIVNAANISATTGSKTPHLAGVIYSNNTPLTLCGIYNINKYYDNVTKEDVLILEDQVLDMAIIDTYGPCINANNTSVIVNASQVYNYRNILYTTPSTTVRFHTVVYSGILVGKNFNLDNLRNEGNIKVQFTRNTTLTMQRMNNDYNKLKLFGCFEETSDGCTATNIYNGGDILVLMNSGLDIRFNIYVGGICYKNGNTSFITEEQAKSIAIDPSITGAINNCINNGNVVIAGTYNEATGKMEGYTAGAYYGVTRVGGITCMNESVLANSFNTGSVINYNVVQANSTTKGTYVSTGTQFEVETGGICFLMIGSKAQIKNCANSGTIRSVCASGGNGWVNASGIAVRNDKTEDGDDIGTGGNVAGNMNPQYQNIWFSINYGSVYALNSKTGDTTSAEPQCKAAGLLCLGVLRIINSINYGTIYSNRVAGGIYGYVFMTKITSKLNTGDKIYIANSINYGRIVKLNDYNDNNGIVVSTNQTFSSNEYYGALIGMVHCNNRTPSNLFGSLVISYLINFTDNINIVGKVYNISQSNTTADLNTIANVLNYMATTKTNDNSPYPFHHTNGNDVYGIRSYLKGIAEPTEEVSSTLPCSATQLSANVNGGIFAETFPLRNHPENDPSFDTIETNNLIYDYIEFVPYSKVNKHLLDVLGFDDSLIYTNAVQALLNDYNQIANIIEQRTANVANSLSSSSSTNIYNSILSGSLSSDIDDVMINDVVESLITSSDNTAAEINILYQALLSDDNFLNYLLTNHRSELFNFITTILNDEILNPDELLEDLVGSNYDFSDIYDLVKSLSITTVEDCFDDYVNPSSLPASTNEEIITNVANYTGNEFSSFMNELSEAGLIDQNALANLINGLTNTQIQTLFNNIKNDANVGTAITNIINGTSGNYQFNRAGMIFFKAVNGIANITYSQRLASGTGYVVDASGDTYAGLYTLYNNQIYKMSELVSVLGTTYESVYFQRSTNGRSNYRWNSGRWQYRSTTSTSYPYTIVNSTDSPTIYRKSGTSYYTHLNGEYMAYTNATNVISGSQYFTVQEIKDLLLMIASQSVASGTLINALINQLGSSVITSLLNNTATVYQLKEVIVAHEATTGGNTTLLDLIIENGITREFLINRLIDTYLTQTTSLNDVKYLLNALSANTSSIIDLLSNGGIQIISKLYNLDHNGSISLSDAQKIEMIALYTYQNLDDLESIINRDLNPTNINDLIDTFTHLNDTYEGFDKFDYIDSIGIYALSSSKGILNGEFLPDNINFIGLDPIVATDGSGNPITDDTWRGIQFGQPGFDDVSNQNSVSYRFATLMKQLEFSIATNVFKATLTDEVKSGEDYIIKNDYYLTNDIKYDYDLINRVITYYVAENDDILNADYLTVSLEENRIELSNGAYIRNNCHIEIPQIVNAGDILEGNVIINAEHPDVRRSYKIKILITAAKVVNSITSVSMNNSALTLNTDFTIDANKNININNSNSIDEDGGSIQIRYTVDNIPLESDLSEKVKVYSFENNNLTTLVNENHYSLNATVNNCIVTNTTYNAVSSSWSTGNLLLDIKIDSSLPSNYYAIVLELTTTNVYKTVFFKIANTASEIVEMVFASNNNVLTVAAYDNVDTFTSTIDYGTLISYDDIMNMNYLYDITLSANATYSIVSAIVEEVGGLKVYTIQYHVVSESQLTSKDFYHVIREIEPSITLERLYKNNSIIDNNQASKTFARQETPTYRFQYNYENSNLYFSEDINDNFLEAEVTSTASEMTSDDYSVDTVSYLETYLDFVIYESAQQGTYTFDLYYRNSYFWKNDEELIWDKKITSDSIVKDKSMESLLKDISFSSETVLTTIETIAQANNEITVEDYETIRNNQNRDIVCLPSGIYYNNNTDQASTFYIIGLVSKTNLESYSPTFVTPDYSKIYKVVSDGSTLYRVLTYKNGDDVVYFYALEDMSALYYYDINTNSYVFLSNTLNTVTYESVEYTLSSTNGSSDDSSMSDNFYNDDSETFVYVRYRVYSEKFDANNANRVYCKDYYVSVQDITNTVKFDITVVNKTNASLPFNNCYLRLTNLLTVDNEEIYQNFMSIFAFVNVSDNQNGSLLTHNKFATNVSGTYYLTVDLPDGYTFGFYYTLKGINYGSSANPLDETSPIDVESAVITRIVYMTIEIKSAVTNDPWGQHSEIDQSVINN